MKVILGEFLSCIVINVTSILNINNLLNTSCEVDGCVPHALHELFYLSFMITLCYVFMSYLHYADEELEGQIKMFASEWQQFYFKPDTGVSALSTALNNYWKASKRTAQKQARPFAERSRIIIVQLHYSFSLLDLYCLLTPMHKFGACVHLS